MSTGSRWWMGPIVDHGNWDHAPPLRSSHCSAQPVSILQLGLVWLDFPGESRKPGISMKLMNLKCWQQIQNCVAIMWAKQNTPASQTTSRDLEFVISGEDHQLASHGRWMLWALACTLNQPCAVGRDCEHPSLLGKSSGPCQHYLCVQSPYLPRCSIRRKLFGDKNIFMEVDNLQADQGTFHLLYGSLSGPAQQHWTSEQWKLLLINCDF